MFSLCLLWIYLTSDAQLLIGRLGSVLLGKQGRQKRLSDSSPLSVICTAEGFSVGDIGCHMPLRHRRVLLPIFFARCLVDKPPPDLESAKTAPSALRGAKTTHYSEGLHGPSPYEQDNVSMPQDAGICLLVDALEAEDRSDLLGFPGRLLLDILDMEAWASKEGKSNDYWDIIDYIYFINHLKKRGMLRFGLAAKSSVGIFL